MTVPERTTHPTQRPRTFPVNRGMDPDLAIETFILEPVAET